MSYPWLPPYFDVTEPSPSPWRSAISSLVTMISLGEVASRMQEGKAKDDLARWVDRGTKAFIDGCGTLPPGWPWPWPPPSVSFIVSELTATANTIADGNTRNELLRVSGQIVERAEGSTGKKEVRVPPDDELMAMTAFSSKSDECEVLCADLLDALEEFQGTTGLEHQKIAARIRALRQQMLELKCNPCLPH